MILTTPAEFIDSMRPAEKFPNSSDGRQSDLPRRVYPSPLNGSAQADFREFPESAKQTIRQHYAGLIQIIEHQVGRILNAIKSRILSEDTDLLHQITLIFW